MSDGSIRIETKIDNSGLEKGYKELLQATNKEISTLERQFNDAQKVISNMSEKMMEAQEKLKTIDINSPQADKLAIQIDKCKNEIFHAKRAQEELTGEIAQAKVKQSEYNNKIEEAKEKQKKLNQNTEGISKSVSGGIKSILKYGMALLSIRSVYGMMSNMMNSWLSGNSKGAKQLKSDIDYMKNAIGRALSPVLKYIVDLLYQALGLAGALIKAFTGIDIFAGSVADYMESTTSSASSTNKELKKQLTSFDRINKLENNQSSGSGSGGSILPSQDLSSIMSKYTDFAENLKEKFNDIKDIIPIIGAGILAWKLSDLFSSDLKTLGNLKQKIGLTLIVAGAITWIDGIKGFHDGEITSEDVLKSLAGVLGLGVGAGILTGSVPIGITVAAVFAAITWLDYGNQKMWYPLQTILGVENLEKNKGKWYADMLFDLSIFISDITATYDVLDKFFPNLTKYMKDNMDDVSLNVAKYVEKIPVIGKSIANGIRLFVGKGQTDIQDTIVHTTTGAINGSVVTVDRSAIELGERVGLKESDGIFSTKMDLTNSLREVIEYSKQQSEAKAAEAGDKLGEIEGISMQNSISSGRAGFRTSIENTISSATNDSANNVEENGTKTAGKYISGFKEEIERNTNSTTNTVSNVIRDASNNADTSSASRVGDSAVDKINQSIRSRTSSITNTTSDVIRDASNNVDTSNYNSVGSSIVAGIKNGINGSSWSLSNTMSKLGSSMLSSFKAAMSIHSPSKKMYELARYIPLGIAEGVDATSDKAIGSMKNLVYGMQDVVDEIDYGSIAKIPKIPKNAVSYTPKQAISTQEVQRSIVGTDSSLLNKLLTNVQGNGNRTITIPLIIDGEEFIRKTIQLNDEYNFATNGGGL